MAYVALSLPIAAVAGLAWAAVYRWRVALDVGTIAQGAWVTAGSLALTAFALGADPDSGMSRLDAQACGSFTYPALALGVVAVSMLIVARRTGRRDLAAAGFICSTVAVLLQCVAFLANAPLE
jgi:hypothetical protein